MLLTVVSFTFSVYSSDASVECINTSLSRHSDSSVYSVTVVYCGPLSTTPCTRLSYASWFHSITLSNT